MKTAYVLAALSWLGPVAQAAAAGSAPVLVTLAHNDSAALLGVWDGQRWLSPPEAVPKVKADTPYRTQGLSGPGLTARGGAPASYDGPCPDFFDVALKPVRMAAQSVVAVRADLTSRPRPVTRLPVRTAAYQAIIKAELQKRGLKAPPVEIQSIVRADLDGDGQAEVILEASHFQGSDAPRPLPSPNAAAGDYSLLLLRSVVGGQVKTTVLGADVVLKASSDIGAPRLNTHFGLEGVADLNGDGQMEIITSESYYEGFTLYGWTWTPTYGLQKVLATGCGV